ncbi:MAG TPA: hypothetical protein VH044_13440 [Polyangiaceae bacterium]|nr:hypothetical protein [Polyangiaceae bacterium]
MLSRSIVSLCAVSGALALLPTTTARTASATDDGIACGAPFDNPGGVTSVKPHKVVDTNLKHSWTRVDGAVVTVPAEPGVTREWLQRQVDDPMAAAQPGCPMAVNGASARVTSTGNGFAVTLVGKDKDSSKEILRRAQALTSSP